jgi:hypothetical protein
MYMLRKEGWHFTWVEHLSHILQELHQGDRHLGFRHLVVLLQIAQMETLGMGALLA